jgi:hypothetical protein
MDEVIPFIGEFIRAEFEARRAMFTENDDDDGPQRSGERGG